MLLLLNWRDLEMLALSSFAAVLIAATAMPPATAAPTPIVPPATVPVFGMTNCSPRRDLATNAAISPRATSAIAGTGATSIAPGRAAACTPEGSPPN